MDQVTDRLDVKQEGEPSFNGDSRMGVEGTPKIFWEKDGSLNQTQILIYFKTQKSERRFLKTLPCVTWLLHILLLGTRVLCKHRNSP